MNWHDIQIILRQSYETLVQKKQPPTFTATVIIQCFAFLPNPTTVSKKISDQQSYYYWPLQIKSNQMRWLDPGQSQLRGHYYWCNTGYFKWSDQISVNLSFSNSNVLLSYVHDVM
jgi:hypothetical protein